MNIHFTTFGCKVNTYETAAMREMFEAEGFTPTDDAGKADIFCINSCTVTAESTSKLHQMLRRIRREHPDRLILLTGCYPQAFPEEAKKELCADIVTGTKKRRDAVNAVIHYIKEHGTLHRDGETPVFGVEEYGTKDTFEEMSVSAVSGHTRAFVKIQDGCNRFCSYCIIPYSRGRIRSKPVDELKNEVERLAANGYCEIVLVGINLAFYGAELGLRLADACEAVCSVNGIKRLRLGSLEPEMLTDDDLYRLKALEQFCPSFHLSLQSGCDRTLAAMNRHYTCAEFSGLAGRIRSIFPDCSITTDIMTGFPDETEEDHRKSVQFVHDIGFSDIHVFPYSQRKGTKADLMENQIPQEVKHRRAAEMTEAGKYEKEKFLSSLVGNVYPILFEKEKNSQFHNGYSPNYTYIKILQKKSEKSLRNMIFYVKIDRIENGCCIGHIVDDVQDD